jgi:pyruvate kinase
MYQAGMNIIRINMAYGDQKMLSALSKNRTALEKIYNCHIPIVMDLKSSIVRLGRFEQAWGVTLTRGAEFRITTESKLIGDQHIVACDSADLGKTVEIGDKILVDYGRTSLTVKKIEKESESLAKLKEKYPNEYTNGFRIRTKVKLHKIDKTKQHVEESKELQFSSQKSSSDTEFNSRKGSHDDSEEETETITYKDTPVANLAADSSGRVNTPSERPRSGSADKRSKYDGLKKKKVKGEKDVVLCVVDDDCQLKSDKPFFIYSRKKIKKYESINDLSKLATAADAEEAEEDFTPISARDIKDINAAEKYEVDCIIVSEIRKASHIKEARYISGNNKGIKILAKIQNAEAIANFDEILKEADGIVISRGYLSVHVPVQKLFFKQKEMIKKCHEAGKPVMIVSQLLDSMVTSLVPTTSEVNDISNLILDGVDILSLVNETTYGHYRKEAIETLSTICLEIEHKEYLERQSMELHGHGLGVLYSYPNNTKMPTYKPPQKNIASTIVNCVMRAVNELDAKLIVCFTQTGSTALQLSKLRSNCPIVSVAIDDKTARLCSMLASVTAVKVGSMYGKDELTKRVLGLARDKKWITDGDYIVASFGEIEGIPGQTNSLKILKA